MKITDEIVKRATDAAERSHVKIYWAWNDKLSDSDIQKIISEYQKNKKSCPQHSIETEVQDYIFDNALDYILEQQSEAARDVLQQEFEDDCESKEELEELIDALTAVDYSISCVADINVEHFMGATTLCRLELLSDYDCMNFWTLSEEGKEIGGLDCGETYLGDVCRVLRIGKSAWDKYKQDNNRDTLELVGLSEFEEGPLVDLFEFERELNNLGEGANLWTIAFQLSLSDFDTKSFKITEGVSMGLFDSTYGGGSVMSCGLIKGEILTINPGEPIFEGRDFPQWRLVFDKCSG